MISVGGADHGVFLWRFLPEGVEEEEDIEGVSLLTGQCEWAWSLPHSLILLPHTDIDSDSEASDSELSDSPSLDSDIEQEQEKSYERLNTTIAYFESTRSCVLRNVFCDKHCKCVDN